MGDMNAAGTWLVVGLGNPGAKYAANRHNAGQLVLDQIARENGGAFRAHKARALVATVRVGIGLGGAPGPQAFLAKPASYMNISGAPVAALCTFYKIPPARVLVLHDELDLPPHELRLKFGGGEGGHNGLKSISQALGTREYARLRVGVGRPPGRMDPADYVLSDFPGRERPDWDLTFRLAADAVTDVLTMGLAQATQRLHTN